MAFDEVLTRAKTCESTRTTSASASAGTPATSPRGPGVEHRFSPPCRPRWENEWLAEVSREADSAPREPRRPRPLRPEATRGCRGRDSTHPLPRSFRISSLHWPGRLLEILPFDAGIEPPLERSNPPRLPLFLARRQRLSKIPVAPVDPAEERNKRCPKGRVAIRAASRPDDLKSM